MYKKKRMDECEYYPTNIIKKKYRRNNLGNLDGEQYQFWENGDLMMINHYENGIQNGFETFYYPSKIIGFTVNYVHGVREGCATSYDKYGRLKYICNYKNDQLNGVYKEFYLNGYIKKIYNYENDHYNGECASFDLDGTRWIEYYLSISDSFFTYVRMISITNTHRMMIRAIQIKFRKKHKGKLLDIINTLLSTDTNSMINVSMLIVNYL
jgi:hypothetical protein